MMRKIVVYVMALGALLVSGCADKKTSQPADSDSVPEKADTIVRVAPETPDYVMNQVHGDVEYVVVERFSDPSCKELEQGDSIRFNDEGWWIGTTTWSGRGYQKSVYSDISIIYDADGNVTKAEDVVCNPALRVQIERNDSLQLVKVVRLDSSLNGEGEMMYQDSWEWRGLTPSRYECSAWEAFVSRRYDYADEGIDPTRSLSKSENEDGHVTEELIYDYTKRDAEGNWTERRVKATETIHEYDVNVGRVVQVGKPTVRTYLERRRIGYRRGK